MNPDYDIVIIGGGINGAGAAQAAAAAGYSVMVLEKTALAAGTSSKSSKLIHGGLRYLESGRLRLVRESLRERATLLRIAPELVRLVPFYIPVYRHTRRRPWQIAAGLTLYAALGGFSKTNRFSCVARSEWSTLDGIDTRNLECVFRYYDGQTDDAALTRAVMQSAQTLGTQLRLPAEFVAARRVERGWSVDYFDGRSATSCTAYAIINAAGPWANQVLSRITPRPSLCGVDLVQGTHVALDTPVQRGIYYVEAHDGRAVFVMPWHQHTLVGTTEVAFAGDPAHAAPSAQEIEYLLKTFHDYFPQREARVLDSSAGLRVLPTASSSLFSRSRETEFHPDDARRPQLITIYGGKLTGYRLTGARAVKHLRAALPDRQARADTAVLPI